MSEIPIEVRAKRRVLSYWLVGGGLAFGYALMRGSNWQGSAQLHTLMEGLAFLLALVVGAMALVRFYAKKNNTFLFIGTGFFGTALLDGYHTVVTSAFFAPYLPSDLGALIPWSWVASRLFLSALMCLSWLAWRREQRLGAAGRIGEYTVYLITGSLTLASFLFFAFVPLPRAYYPEIVFHRPEEFVPAVLFLVALVGYLRKGKWRLDAFEHWLVLSLIVGFVSQAVFMSFSGTLFDLEFDAAHLLKKVSYVCVLTGLLFSMYAIFRQVEERESILKIMVADAQEAQSRIEAQAAELVVQAESLALTRDAAMSAAAAKSDFLANMSHELRTPLNAMLGFSEMIEQEVFGPLGHGKYAEFIKIIGQSGRHLLTVINDILDYSKIEAGKLELDPVAFDLSQVADSTVELLASAAHDKAIELACFVGPEVPMSLIGDPGRIRQVLLNLVGNAIKFTEAGGVRVDVSLEAVDGDEVLLRFEISDTGIGITEDEQKNLFDKFSQADVSTTRKYGGTGLGLAISKQLVGLMNGELGFDSQLDRGSIFWFTVTLAKQAIAGKGILAKITETMRGRRTLVVDDNPINRLVCKQYLEMLGAEVTTAADAQAALSALAGAVNDIAFEVAIIDHMMPGIDGVELGRRIRAETRYGDLKMVLSSSSGLVLSHGSARELGFEAALSKPLHRTVVLKCLGYLYDVVLPQTGADAPEVPVSASACRSLYILVAEDNKVNQLLLDTILRGAGHRVDVANNGQEAVEAVREHSYDLVLMDVHMPELNGLEATRRIRRMPGADADIPILAVTAAVMGEDRVKCYQAGMSDFVSKPIDKRQLFEKIAYWTGTEIFNPTETLKQSHDGGDPELSEDAAAALDDLLDSIDDVAGEASLIRQSKSG